MEQATYKQEYITEEQAVQTDFESEPSFGEREQVMERFASTPMAYSVNGTTYKASGSGEAVMLCEFLQNDKLPAAFLEIKFQEAADFLSTLDDDELQPAEETPNEDISSVDEAQPSTEASQGQSETTADSRSDSGDSAGEQSSVATTQSSSEPSVTERKAIAAEQLAAAIIQNGDKNDENDTVVKLTEKKEIDEEDAEPGSESKSVFDNEILSLPTTEELPGSQLDEITIEDELLEFGSTEIEQLDKQAADITENERTLEVEVPESSEPDDISSVDLITEEITEPLNDEFSDSEQYSDNLDSPENDAVILEVYEHDELSLSVEDTFPPPVQEALFTEFDNNDPIESFSLPDNDLSEDATDVRTDIEPEQEAAFIELNELLTSLSQQTNENDHDELEDEEVATEPVRIEQLYKCLEAQVQAVNENQGDVPGDHTSLEAIHHTLVDILGEMEYENAELLAKLYLETYGIDGLLDIIQSPVVSKAQNNNQLVEQCHKIARFTTRLMIHHDDTVISGAIRLANAA